MPKKLAYKSKITKLTILILLFSLAGCYDKTTNAAYTETPDKPCEYFEKGETTNYNEAYFWAWSNAICINKKGTQEIIEFKERTSCGDIRDGECVFRFTWFELKDGMKYPTRGENIASPLDPSI